MVVGVRGITNLSDRLRYSLVPPEKVSDISYQNPVVIGFVDEYWRTMILRGNAWNSLVLTTIRRILLL